MGVVFRVLDQELGEEIAVKVLVTSFDSLVEEEELLARFKRETNLNRRVKHPNIARVHDFGVAGELHYITMEYIGGKDLTILLAERGRLPVELVVSVLRQVAQGTAAAHELGIIHRDLKCQNIMVDSRGSVSLLDFGMARRKFDPALTKHGFVVGTISYMSPEQLRGLPADTRSDIYSIGVVAFHALTGHAPFSGQTPVATAYAVVNEPVPAQDLDAADVPPALSAIVLRCLAKAPEDRFESAQELERALETFARGPDEAGIDPEDESCDAFFEVESAGPPLIETDARTVASARPTVPHPGPGADSTKRRPVVVVADEDSGCCGLIASYLADTECDTLQANDAQEALEMIFSRQIDLLVMDVGMPVMDGFDAVRVLRSLERTAKLPVILTSSTIDRNRLAFAVQAGANDLVPKPLDKVLLCEKVESLLKQRLVGSSA